MTKPVVVLCHLGSAAHQPSRSHFSILAELWCHGGQPPSGLFNQGFGHCSDGGFLKWGGYPKNGWCIMENPITTDDLGVTHFRKPIYDDPPPTSPKEAALAPAFQRPWSQLARRPLSELQSQPDAYVCIYIYIWLPPHVDPPHLYITCYCMYPIQLQYCNFTVFFVC